METLLRSFFEGVPMTPEIPKIIYNFTIFCSLKIETPYSLCMLSLLQCMSECVWEAVRSMMVRFCGHIFHFRDSRRKWISPNKSHIYLQICVGWMQSLKLCERIVYCGYGYDCCRFYYGCALCHYSIPHEDSNSIRCMLRTTTFCNSSCSSWTPYETKTEKNVLPNFTC